MQTLSHRRIFFGLLQDSGDVLLFSLMTALRPLHDPGDAVANTDSRCRVLPHSQLLVLIAGTA